MVEHFAAGLPELRHLLAELLEDPRRLPRGDRLPGHLAAVAVLLDRPPLRRQHLVDLQVRERGVPLPEVEPAHRRDRDERAQDDRVADRPRGDGEHGREDENGGAAHRRGQVSNRARAGRAAGFGPGPGHPQGHDRHEVEGELAREGREAPEKAGDRGRAARAARVGRERPLDRPPQEQQEQRLRPVVGGVPEELRIEGRDGGGEEARPGARRRERRPGPRRGRAGRRGRPGPTGRPASCRRRGRARRRSTGRPGGRRRGRCAAARTPPPAARSGGRSRSSSARRRSGAQRGSRSRIGATRRASATAVRTTRARPSGAHRRGRGLGGRGHEDRPILDRPAALRPLAANELGRPAA